MKWFTRVPKVLINVQSRFIEIIIRGQKHYRNRQQRGILFAHARDEWNNLSSAPFVIFERAAVGFLTGDLHCEKDLVKRDERF